MEWRRILAGVSVVGDGDAADSGKAGGGIGVGYGVVAEFGRGQQRSRGWEGGGSG